MKIAIVYDYIPKIGGGAERVLTDIIKTFSPNCDLFLGAVVESPYSKNYMARLREEFPSMNITISRKVSFLQPLFFRIFNYNLVQIMQSFDLSKYDVVFCYTAFLSHTIITPQNAKKIVYMNTPSRSLWHLVHSTSKLKQFIPPVFMHILQSGIRLFDIMSLKGADKVIAISQSVKRRIFSFYNIPVGVLYPPVHAPLVADTSLVSKIRKEVGEYYIHFSRIESYKNIQLLVKTAHEFMPEKKIIIAGDGPYKKNLIQFAEKAFKQKKQQQHFEFLQKSCKKVGNIYFTGFISEEQKSALVAGAKASFSLNDEDFGIVKVESLYLGTPVIALNAGASPEVIRNTIDGVLFENDTPESLWEAIKTCASLQFDSDLLKKRALLFSPEAFTAKLLTLLQL